MRPTHIRDYEMKKNITIVSIAVLIITLLASCGSGGLNGTYVACNDIAKETNFAKFVFNDEEVGFLGKVFKKNTVKVYMGVFGVTIPSAEEYTYSIKGDKLIIEGGIPGVNGQSIEFTYNKELDEISMNMDYAFDILGGIAQQIGDHHDQLEEINAQLGHRKENKANINANQVSQELKQLVGDITPVWCKEGAVYVPPTAKGSQQSSTPSSDEKKEKEKQAAAEASHCADNFWKNSPNSFCQALAERCAEYSYAVYYSEKEKIGNDCPVYKENRDNYKKGSIEYLLGQVYDKETIEYNRNSDEDGIGFALAYKKVDGEVILAVVIRGTCNGCLGDEWKGNMNIGTGNRHESFDKANGKVKDTIKKYIERKGLKNKDIKLLITGHSRGAGVGNLLATDCIENKNWCNGNIKSVYAYLFATPNCIKTTHAKENTSTSNVAIYNFCFNDDFVTRVPLEQWGYGKSGTTFRAVAQGLTATNPDFARETQNCYFNSTAVSNVINNVYGLCSKINDYYDKELLMGKWDIPSKRPLHGFMREYVAQATIDSDKGVTDNTIMKGTAAYGLLFKAWNDKGNDVHKIAAFFIDGDNMCAQKYIADTHDMPTYIAALKNNGFCTLYLYRNQK